MAPKRDSRNQRYIPNTSEVFWDYVRKTDGCWEWTGGLTKGYGSFAIDGKTWRAHRYSYLLAHGPFDQKLFVCHTCDNRACVNPDHLFLGTIQDNNRDCFLKKRHTKGEMRCFKLTEDDVRLIREMYKPYVVMQKQLAENFGVSRSMIDKIVRREEWKHI